MATRYNHKRALGEVTTYKVVQLKIGDVFTDAARFQNRQGAFSEASARNVAENYRPELFDPIVVWLDPRDGRTYVLSGHSRLEGMKRRGEKTIPARYFNGTEGDAIRFARADANRASTKETLFEDLTAYRLARDGDEKLGIQAATKAELSRLFPGRVSKLDAWSYLNPNGQWMLALELADKGNSTDWPQVERRAQWIGELRRQYPEITDVHERDIFYWTYSKGTKAMRLDKDGYLKAIRQRIAKGGERLFPECREFDCRAVSDLTELFKSQFEKDVMRRLDEVRLELEQIDARARTQRPSMRIYTEPERDAVRAVRDALKAERDRLRKELDVAEKAADAPDLFAAVTAAPGAEPVRPANAGELFKMVDETAARPRPAEIRAEAETKAMRRLHEVRKREGRYDWQAAQADDAADDAAPPASEVDLARLPTKQEPVLYLPAQELPAGTHVAVHQITGMMALMRKARMESNITDFDAAWLAKRITKEQYRAAGEVMQGRGKKPVSVVVIDASLAPTPEAKPPRTRRNTSRPTEPSRPSLCFYERETVPKPATAEQARRLLCILPAKDLYEASMRLQDVFEGEGAERAADYDDMERVIAAVAAGLDWVDMPYCGRYPAALNGSGKGKARKAAPWWEKIGFDTTAQELYRLVQANGYDLTPGNHPYIRNTRPPYNDRHLPGDHGKLKPWEVRGLRKYFRDNAR